MVLNIIQSDQHTRFFKVSAEIPDIEHNKAVMQLHIGGVRKKIHAAESIHLQRQRQILRLRLIVGGKYVIEISQRRHILRSIAAGNVRLVNRPQGAVNQRFFGSGQPAALKYRKQRLQHIRLGQQEVLVSSVIPSRIKRIDMVFGARCQPDHSPAVCPAQLHELPLRVNHNNLIPVSGEQHIIDLHLGVHRLPCAGLCHNKAVTVLGCFAV